MRRRAYPEYKSTGVEWLGQVPEHWEVKPLKYICSKSAIYGANESAENYIDEGVRFLRTTDIDDNGCLHQDDAMYIEESLVKDYLLQDGDLLISRSGTIGRCFLYDSQIHEKCAYAGYLVRFTLKKIFSPRFVFYFTKSQSFMDWLSISVISSTIGNVNGQKYASMILALPPYNEQQNVADFLDHETNRIDVLIEKKERQIELLQEKRSALITQAVTKGHNPNARMKYSGVEWLGEIPEHWDLERLKYCLQLISTKTVSRENPIALENIESWTGRYIPVESEFESEGVAVEAGDILFGKLRPYLAKVLLMGSKGVAIGDFFVLRPNKKCFGKFASYLLRTRNVINIINGSTYGAKMPRVNWEFMGNLKFLLPPISEQQSIVNFLNCETERIDTLIDKISNSIAKLREYRSALISTAVTGKIDVRKDSVV